MLLQVQSVSLLALVTGPDLAADSECYCLQSFTAGATEAGALEVVPDTVDLIGFLAGYTARLPAGPVGYYINDRFLLSVPDELAESLLSLFANATSQQAVLLIAPAPPSVGGRNNSDTAFGYRDTWYVWVWPFWLRTDGGAAVDGELLPFANVLMLYMHCMACNRLVLASSKKLVHAK